MNYPSLCLSSELIEKAFSKRNAAPQKRSPTRIIPQHGPKANISEPLNQSNFENGEIKDCDDCDYKTLTYEDLFNHIKLTHVKKGIKQSHKGDKILLNWMGSGRVEQAKSHKLLFSNFFRNQ